MFQHPLRTALAAFTLGLAAAASAHAGYIVGQWDPDFGQPFGQMGWKGEVRLDFSDNTLGTCVPGSNLVGCTPITLTYAHVTLYNVNTPAVAAEVLDFTNYLTLTSLVLDGQRHFVGFSAQAAGALQSQEGTGLTKLGQDNAWFGLRFAWANNQTTADLLYTNNPGSCNGESPSDDCFVGNNSDVNHGSGRTSPIVTFTAGDGLQAVGQIPEPASLALAASALAAAALARRRRAVAAAV